jgi:two-component system response regulator NreC
MANFENNSEHEINKNTRDNIEDKKIRVFVADDSKPMLAVIVRLLTPHFEVVGTAADGQAALEMIDRLQPEIAVLDISMPYKTGIEVAADLKESGSAVKVVIMTAHDDEYYISAALSVGASAFIPKTRLGAELIPALEKAHSEKLFISADDDLTESCS